jgi:hypothetical protein
MKKLCHKGAKTQSLHKRYVFLSETFVFLESLWRISSLRATSVNKRFLAALSVGGLQYMFWGAFFGSCTDKFGVPRMFNCSAKSSNNEIDR